MHFMDDDVVTQWRADLETARGMLQHAPLDARDRMRRLVQTIQQAKAETLASAGARAVHERVTRFLETSEEAVAHFQDQAAQRQRSHLAAELRHLHEPIPGKPVDAGSGRRS